MNDDTTIGFHGYRAVVRTFSGLAYRDDFSPYVGDADDLTAKPAYPGDDVTVRATIDGLCTVTSLPVLRVDRPESPGKPVLVYFAIVLVFLVGMKIVQGC